MGHLLEQRLHLPPCRGASQASFAARCDRPKLPGCRCDGCSRERRIDGIRVIAPDGMGRKTTAPDLHLQLVVVVGAIPGWGSKGELIPFGALRNSALEKACDVIAAVKHNPATVGREHL